MRAVERYLAACRKAPAPPVATVLPALSTAARHLRPGVLQSLVQQLGLPTTPTLTTAESQLTCAAVAAAAPRLPLNAASGILQALENVDPGLEWSCRRSLWRAVARSGELAAAPARHVAMLVRMARGDEESVPKAARAALAAADAARQPPRRGGCAPAARRPGLRCDDSGESRVGNGRHAAERGAWLGAWDEEGYHIAR